MIRVMNYIFSLLKIVLGLLIFFIFSNLMPVIHVFSVPYTLQTICIMLIPFFMSTRELLIWYISLLILTALGFPLMSNMSGGIGVLQGLTAGFIYGWFLQMFIIKQYSRCHSGFIWLVTILFLTTVLDVICGALWNMIMHQQPANILINYCVKLLPFGFIKALVTVILIKCLNQLINMKKLALTDKK